MIRRIKNGILSTEDRKEVLNYAVSVLSRNKNFSTDNIVELRNCVRNYLKHLNKGYRKNHEGIYKYQNVRMRRTRKVRDRKCMWRSLNDEQKLSFPLLVIV